MVQLAIGPCKRDWGQNTSSCKILLSRAALIAKCATLFSWAAFKEKEVKEEEEEKRLWVHFDSCVDTRIGRIIIYRLSQSSLRLWLLSMPSSHYNAVFRPQSSVLDERVDIHSLHHWPFIDSSCSNSTKDCTIPTLLSSSSFASWVYLSAAAAAPPLIYSNCLQRSQTVKAFQLQNQKLMVYLLWFHVFQSLS